MALAVKVGEQKKEEVQLELNVQLRLEAQQRRKNVLASEIAPPNSSSFILAIDRFDHW